MDLHPPLFILEECRGLVSSDLGYKFIRRRLDRLGLFGNCLQLCLTEEGCLV